MLFSEFLLKYLHHSLFGLIFLSCHQAIGADAPEAKFRNLPAVSQQQLDKQRAFVAGLVARHLPGKNLSKNRNDIAILQQLVDLKLIPKHKTWELQSLGVVFGDALIDLIPDLAWSEVTDEYGTDPTLRFKNTSYRVNALTMLSKRIESAEEVNVMEITQRLIDWTNQNAHKIK
jgi:hypothetical protein